MIERKGEGDREGKKRAERERGKGGDSETVS